MLKKILPLFLSVALLALGAASALAAPPQQDGQDVVDIAVGDGRFTTLVTALTEAGLVDTLKGEGPFTVFAPTDDAFAALPAGTLEGLLADKEALAKVLTYHVVPGKVMAADVVSLSSANTVEGEPISIAVNGGNVMVNNANVIITDIEGTNGVIHVIDAVILPPSMSAAAAPAQLPATGGNLSTTASTSLILLAVGLLLATTGAAFKWGFAHKR